MFASDAHQIISLTQGISNGRFALPISDEHAKMLYLRLKKIQQRIDEHVEKTVGIFRPSWIDNLQKTLPWIINSLQHFESVKRLVNEEACNLLYAAAYELAARRQKVRVGQNGRYEVVVTVNGQEVVTN